jgi:hypothetical protein
VTRRRPDKYGAGLKRAIENGRLALRGTYAILTTAGAEMFA